MTIEFFGMPGSGKTTVARQLCDQESWVIVRSRNNAELIFYNFIFLIVHPFRFVRLLSFIVRNSTTLTMFWYKFTNLFLHTNANYIKARGCNRAILDQGYVQNILSLFEHQINTTEMFKYIKLTFPPDHLAVFDVPFVEMEKRISERSYIVREEFGDEPFKNRLKVMRNNFDLFLKNRDSLFPNSWVFDSLNTKEQIYSSVRYAISKT